MTCVSLNDEDDMRGLSQMVFKQVEDDQEHYYENQDSMRQRKVAGPGSGLSLERKASFLSDGTFDSISESETSTAPSSLQTIVRAPYSLGGLSQYGALSGILTIFKN